MKSVVKSVCSKSTFLSSKIKFSRKDRLNLLADTVLEIIIVRCHMTFRSRTKSGCEFNYKDMPLFINNLIGAALNSKYTKLIGCYDTKHIYNDVTHI